MSAIIDQIKLDAAYAIKTIGPKSGMQPFGYNVRSIASLDGFLERQAGACRSDAEMAERLSLLLGAFLGEAIIAMYGGAWQERDGEVNLEIRHGESVTNLNPFQKVHKRLTVGPQESLLHYVKALAEIVSPKKGALKRPWWKFF